MAWPNPPKQELGILEGQKFTRAQERVNDRRILRWLVAFPEDAPIANECQAEIAKSGDDRPPPAETPYACAEPATEAVDSAPDTELTTEDQAEVPLPPAINGNGNGHIDGEQYGASRSYNVSSRVNVRAAGISIFIAARDGVGDDGRLLTI